MSAHILPRGFFSPFGVAPTDLAQYLGCEVGDLTDLLADVDIMESGELDAEAAATVEAEYLIAQAHLQLPGKYHGAATELVNLAVAWRVARAMERTAAKRLHSAMEAAAQLGMSEVDIADIAGSTRTTVRRARGK